MKCHEVERVENLTYHWHCKHCDGYWPFHCYRREDLEKMECPARTGVKKLDYMGETFKYGTLYIDGDKLCEVKDLSELTDTTTTDPECCEPAAILTEAPEMTFTATIRLSARRWKRICAIANGFIKNLDRPRFRQARRARRLCNRWVIW